jgi:hypothetical protein
MQHKTQLVARRGELLAEAAQEQLEATKGGEPLAVSGIPGAAISTERAALRQAETYERWARDAAGMDVLLGRAAQALADQLRAVAAQATRLREDARDALEAAEE